MKTPASRAEEHETCPEIKVLEGSGSRLRSHRGMVRLLGVEGALEGFITHAESLEWSAERSSMGRYRTISQ